MHQCSLRLSRELLAKLLIGDTRLVLDVRRQDPVVALREHLSHAAQGLAIVPAGECERRGARAKLARCAHRYDRRRQTLRNRPHYPLVAGPRAVDLVDEDQRRNAQPLQRARQDARLRLHPLHGRDHENRAVKDAQDPFHLGDEVRVARRIDQIDVDVLQCERCDGRPDRDTALSLQR